MIQLLQPWALVGLATLAIPIALHFLRQPKIKAHPFPSVLYIAEVARREEKKHKIKNLLLLILRLLTLLCLVLALTNPTFKSKSTSIHQPAIFLLNNQAASLVMREDGKTLFDVQMQMAELLKKKHSNFKIIPVIGSSDTNFSPQERWGNMVEALSSLEQFSAIQQNMQGEGEHCKLYIPLLNKKLYTREIDNTIKTLDSLGFEIELLDISHQNSIAWGLQNILDTHKSGDSSWVFELNRWSNTELPSAITWTSIDLQSQNIPIHQNQIVWQVPETSSTWILGSFANAEPETPWNHWPIAIPPTSKDKAHLYGTSAAFEAALYTYTSQKSTAENTSTQLSSIPTNLPSQDFLIVTREPTWQEARQLREWVRSGGFLVLSPHPDWDVKQISEALLQPAGIGALGEWHVSADWETTPTVAPHTGPKMIQSTFNQLNPSMKNFPNRARLDFHGTGLSPWLSIGQETPLVGFANYGAGNILLWLTPIQDENLSTLGAQKVFMAIMDMAHQIWAPYTPQKFQVASDSLLHLSIPIISTIRIEDPDGKQFTEWHTAQSELIIGPFAKTGFYRITSQDTFFLAVHCPLPSPPAHVTPSFPATNWQNIGFSGSLANAYSPRFWLLFTALFLLFLETVVLFWHSRMRPEQVGQRLD